MPLMTCDQKIPCCPEVGPCIANPALTIPNYRSDYHDFVFKVGQSFSSPPGLLPPLSGGGWSSWSCNSICESAVSQDDADLCALAQQTDCLLDPPSPGTPPEDLGTSPVGGNAPSPPITTFRNTAQACTVTCGGGGSATFTVPAGTFVAESQILADRMAYSRACFFAATEVVCLGYMRTPTQQQIQGTNLFPVVTNQFDGKCCTGADAEFTIDVGGKGPFSWSVSSGSIPAGMTFAVSPNTRQAIITGSPNDPGNVTFTVRATNTLGFFAEQSYTIKSIQITTSPELPTLVLGEPYSQQLAVSGGDAPYGFVLVSGELPPGLTMNDTGLISGTPTCISGETFSFTIACTDTNGPGCVKTFTTQCGDCTWMDGNTLPSFDQGQPYSYQMLLSGGVFPFSFAVTSGTLPQGLSLSTGGLIHGTAALVNGNLDHTFTVTVTDSVGSVCNKQFTMTVINYNNFPPGKKWRIKTYADGTLNAGCCQVAVVPAWDGSFTTQIGAGHFESVGGVGITNHLTRHGLINFGPSGEWAILLFCTTIPTSAVWEGIKVGSNQGAKLDSPAGTYTLNNFGGYTLCDATATLTIEEF